MRTAQLALLAVTAFGYLASTATGGEGSARLLVAPGENEADQLADGQTVRYLTLVGVSEAGRLLFEGLISNGPTVPFPGQQTWFAVDVGTTEAGPISLVLREGTAMRTSSGASDPARVIDAVDRVFFPRSGRVAFSVRESSPGVPAVRSALGSASSLSLREALNGRAALGSGAVLTGLGEPFVHDDFVYAAAGLRVSTEGEADKLFSLLVGKDAASQVVELARDATSLPGGGGNMYSGNFLPTSVSSDGALIVQAGFRAPGDFGFGANRTAILSRVPGGSLTLLARQGDDAPGVPGTTIPGPFFGAPSASVRGVKGGKLDAAYSVPLTGALEGWAVYDTNAPGAPVIRTGDTHRGATFTQMATGEVRVAACDGNKVVIVDRESAWRYDPAADTKLQVVIFEGMEFQNGVQMTTVKTLQSVHVNSSGRIAAEVVLTPHISTGEAVLIEDKDEPGLMRVALEARDMVATADGGEARVVAIASTNPRLPPLTGPGIDGHATRFRDNGELIVILKGGGTGDVANGIYGVRLEPPPELCDVKVSVRGGSLDIRGGKEGCSITIEGDGGGVFFVRPGEGTSINDEEREFEFDAPKGVKIRMGPGDDRVVFTSSDPAGDRASGQDVGRNLSIDMGAGSDTLIMNEVEIAGSTRITTGNGVFERVDIDDCFFTRNLSIRGGDGKSLIELAGTGADGRTLIQSGGSFDSTVQLIACDMHTTTLRGGNEFDLLTVRRSSFTDTLTIDPGRDILDQITLQENRHEKGALVIRAKRCEAIQILADDIEIDDGGLILQTGKRGCSALFGDSSIDGLTNIKTTGTAEVGDFNKIKFRNCFLEELKLRGKGSLEFVASDGGMFLGASIKAKGGLDTISFTRQEFDEGDIKIRANSSLSARVTFRDCGFEEGNGSITVKTGKAPDFVLFEGGDLNNVTVKTGPGDDEIVMNSFAGEDVLADGGPGTDTDRVDDALEVTGTLTQKNLE